MMPRFYDAPDDCEWLQTTHLRELRSTLPPFRSFVLGGNEDCPLYIDLYNDINPSHEDEPVASFVLDEANTYKPR